MENKTDIVNQPTVEKIEPASTSEYFMRLLGMYRYSKAKTTIIIAAGLIKRMYDQRILKLLERPKKTKILFPITSPKMRRKKDKIIVKAKAMVATIDNKRTFQRERVSC